MQVQRVLSPNSFNARLSSLGYNVGRVHSGDTAVEQSTKLDNTDWYVTDTNVDEDGNVDLRRISRPRAERRLTDKTRSDKAKNPFIEYETREKRMMLERKWLQEDSQYMRHKKEDLQHEKVRKDLAVETMRDEDLYHIRTFYGPHAIKLQEKKSRVEHAVAGVTSRPSSRPSSSPATFVPNTPSPVKSGTLSLTGTIFGGGRGGERGEKVRLTSEIQQMCAELEESRRKVQRTRPDLFPEEVKEQKVKVPQKLEFLKQRLSLATSAENC